MGRAAGIAPGTLDFGGGKTMADKKVLVVDDEIHIVHVVAIKLRNNGFEVISADNGAEGLKLALAEKPDIIVTDYQMPVMTGLELVEKLRQNEGTRETPVVMLTARSFAVPQQQLLGNIEDILHQKQLIADN
jgi:two-component system alkaline phosphatase synthesis response regulator PhoP